MGTRAPESTGIRFASHPHAQTTWEHGLWPLKAKTTEEPGQGR